MQASKKLAEIDEAAISPNNYEVDDWYIAIVPGTVMGALAQYKIIEDPTFGINMKKMDPVQFQKPWWYRTSFQLSKTDLKQQISFCFNGVSARADLWANGKKVADNSTFSGTYRMFTFNINPLFISGENRLDCVDKKYGIREIRSYLNEDKNCAFDIHSKLIFEE